MKMKDKTGSMPMMAVKTEESKAKDKKYEDYEISGAMDALLRAEEIRDKMKDDPQFGKLVSAEIKKKGKAINKITSLDQLKEVANGEPDDMEEDAEEEVEDTEEV